MILMAMAIGLGWDRKIQAAVLDAFPNYGTGITVFENTDAVQKALESRQRN